MLLEQRGLMPAFISAPDVYVAYDGEAGRLAAFPDIQALRAAGFRVEYPLKELAFGKQLKAALESGAKLALLYGGDELARGVVKMRDLTERTEREVPREQVPARGARLFRRGLTCRGGRPWFCSRIFRSRSAPWRSPMGCSCSMRGCAPTG